MQHVVIIGNGIAGITTARFVRKMSDNALTVVSDESEHFYSRTALMYIYMGHMTYENTKPYEDFFWEKNRINLKRGYVERIDADAKTLHLKDGDTVAYDILVIAVGSRWRRGGWPGEDLQGVQGLYGLRDLEAMERHTAGIERAVIAGGGLIGIEMAEMLRSRHIDVSFLVREKQYWSNILPVEEGEMISRHIHSHGVDLHLATGLAEILGDDQGRVRGVRTSRGEEIPCGFVGLTIGVEPNIGFLKDSVVETDVGVLVDNRFATSVSDIYAVGDCVQFRDPLPGHRAIEQLWYTGRKHGETLARTICGRPTPYDRGVWFNSAKFFDIEYQTYGFVANEPRPGDSSLYWEHPGGTKAIRINYRTDDHIVIGFNLFGVRYRHAVCEQWLREGRSVEYVLEHLSDANFDPEFFDRCEKHLVELYNRRNPGREIVLKKKGLLARLFS